MLFLHKNADIDIFNAMNTGERPKGNASAYSEITKDRMESVWANTLQVAKALELDPFQQQMKLVFDKWCRATEHDSKQSDIYKMMTAKAMEERKRAGINADWRYYNNYVDLVLALYGEHCSAAKLGLEKSISEKILSSNSVRDHMIILTTKINIFAETAIVDSKARDKLLDGKYKTLRKDQSADWAKWKRSYCDMPLTELLPSLYDITHAIDINWSESPMHDGKITKANMRVNVSTPEEDFDWTSNARWNEIPIWAAPSYTTHLMLTFATKAKANRLELLAFAYTISAYWCVAYPHSATPVHRMIGVMTAAREFNIPSMCCDPEQMYVSAQLFLVGRLPAMAKL